MIKYHNLQLGENEYLFIIIIFCQGMLRDFIYKIHHLSKYVQLISLFYNQKSILLKNDMYVSFGKTE